MAGKCRVCNLALRANTAIPICKACQTKARKENRNCRMLAGDCLEYLTKKAQAKWIGIALRYDQGLRPTS